MKYRVRRLVAGVVATPVIAGAYFIGYAVLVGAGATATATPSEVWNTGITFGVVATVIAVCSKVVK